MFQTDGEPPSRGSSMRETTGWTENSKNAERNSDAVNPASNREPAARRPILAMGKSDVVAVSIESNLHDAISCCRHGHVRSVEFSTVWEASLARCH